ncbi:transaldolase A [Buchnera aphidicola (Cinara tujafilina)]|uniref:Transaldolase n=1 Tax=Buchnera aphidicola (Cinara tujafilina) TaxID=261317 RepID=F7WZ00_9GAMM|nr:transaldolase [Buchnera aphidicola]AEH39650.1 transaldolase A [Buchnera aphidicola (Cinara tujafilina)]
MNQLEVLKKFTTIVVDSADIHLVHKYKPSDATTNPSIILNNVLSNKYNNIIEKSILYSKKLGGSLEKKVINALDMISVRFGCEILKFIPGYISTEIDAELSFNTDLCIQKSIKIIKLYNILGVDKSRILIKLAATWEGIQAAKYLRKIGILCNLTLLFSFAQAQACADAKVFLISPFVGRIYDWYSKNQNNNDPYIASKDPGVIAIKNIFYHYKKFGYKTIIMGASFRKIEQIIELAGCDKLTISPILLDQLKKCTIQINRKLNYQLNNNVITKPNALSESEFRWLHNKNLMAVEKLAEGINQFYLDKKISNFFIKKNIILESRKKIYI